ncbi:MAG: polysaccharide deacetylase family protein, partial [bacterium]
TFTGPTTANFSAVVLMYHRIVDLTASEKKDLLARQLALPPAEFAKELQYLHDNGYTVLRASDIAAAAVNHTALPEKAIAITLDDGYIDNFTQAYPILKKYNVPATVFIVTGDVGKPGYLSWENIAAMRPLVDFQSHTITHPDLSKITAAQLQKELAGSKAALDDHLKSITTALAYPAGDFNAAVITATRTAGYQYGWKKSGGPMTPGANPYQLPRIRIMGNTGIKGFASIISQKPKPASATVSKPVKPTTRAKGNKPQGTKASATQSSAVNAAPR